jgi:hypothetical protein
VSGLDAYQIYQFYIVGALGFGLDYGLVLVTWWWLGGSLAGQTSEGGNLWQGTTFMTLQPKWENTPQFNDCLMANCVMQYDCKCQIMPSTIRLIYISHLRTMGILHECE